MTRPKLEKILADHGWRFVGDVGYKTDKSRKWILNNDDGPTITTFPGGVMCVNDEEMFGIDFETDVEVILRTVGVQRWGASGEAFGCLT